MKAKLVGINHVAVEVGNVEEALAFYGRIFELTLRGRAGRMAFVDTGFSWCTSTRNPHQKWHPPA
jgi:catechol 2,3-dioxygenase-like lactoylglutathione lyase family enzyme